MKKSKLGIGSYVPDFELPGVDGNVYHLARYLETHPAVAVVFLTNRCATSIQYLPQLKSLQQEFGPSKVGIIAINGVDDSRFEGENFSDMKEFARVQELNFPYIRDFSQDVAYSFGVKVTPTAFLINPQGKLCYQGAIATDQHHYLQQSLEALLEGKPIIPEVTAAQGTNLAMRNLDRRIE